MDTKDLTQLPKTRQEAIELGSKYYFTGKSCKHGHVSKKRVCNSGCFDCKILNDEKNRDKYLIRKREYRIENIDKCRASVRDWRLKYPEKAKIKARESALRHWDKYIARHKEWRSKNRDKVRAETRDYYLRNKDKCHDMVMQWRKENPEAARSIILNRIARKQNAEGSFSKKDITEKLELQNNKCVYCQCDVSVSYHVDHITPLYRGGSNWPDNLQILCPSCNCSKGAKTHDEFIEFLQKQKSV